MEAFRLFLLPLLTPVVPVVHRLASGVIGQTPDDDVAFRLDGLLAGFLPG
jgi:hypothetical protein